MNIDKLCFALVICALVLGGCASDSEEFESNPNATGNDLRFIAADGQYRLDYEVTVNTCDSTRRSGTRYVEVDSYLDATTRKPVLMISDAPPPHLGRAGVVDIAMDFELTQSPLEVRLERAVETTTVREATPLGLRIEHSVDYLPSADPAAPNGCRTEQRWVLTKVD